MDPLARCQRHDDGSYSLSTPDDTPILRISPDPRFLGKQTYHLDYFDGYKRYVREGRYELDEALRVGQRYAEVLQASRAQTQDCAWDNNLPYTKTQNAHRTLER